MWQNPAVLDHLGINCDDVDACAAFYDAVLAPLGSERVMEFDVPGGKVVGYGVPPKPTFWIAPNGEGPANRETHIAFVASTRAAVKAFFVAAVATGAEVLHEPRVFPEYHEHYYGAFVRDPNGHNVEAVCHIPA